MSRDSKIQSNEPRAYKTRREAAARRQREYRKRHPGANNKYVKAHRARKKAKEGAAKQPTTPARHMRSCVDGLLAPVFKCVPPITSPTWRIIVHILLAYVMAIIASRTLG